MLHPAVFRGFSCCPCRLCHRAGQQSSIRDGISTALTTADLPANACRTPPDNDIARGAGLLQRGFPGWRSPAGCGGVGFCLARQRHRPGGRAPTGVFLFGGVLRVVVAWVSALRGSDIARGAGLLQRGFPGWRCLAGCGGVGFCLARQRHRPGGRASTGVFLFGGVLRVVVVWVSALRGSDIARGAGLLQRGFLGWRCLAGCGGMACFLALQGFRPPSRAPAPRSSAWRAALPVGARPPGDWFPRHVPLSGILLRRRPPGESFSCKGFPSIPAPRTGSPPLRTINVTPVTNFVTPRPTHGPSSPGRATRGPVHNRYPIIPKGSLAHGARGAPYPRTHVTGCFSVGCAARTIGDHPGGVRRGERFFAPTTGACALGDDVHGAPGNFAAARSHAPAWERNPGRFGVRGCRWPPTTVPLLPSRARPDPTDEHGRGGGSGPCPR